MHIKLDLGKFKKIASDKKITTLRDPKTGHEVRIAHDSLHPKLRAQISKLPMAKPEERSNSITMMDEGGEAKTLGQKIGYPQRLADGGEVDPDEEKKQKKSIGAKIGYPGAPASPLPDPRENDQQNPRRMAEGGEAKTLGQKIGYPQMMADGGETVADPGILSKIGGALSSLFHSAAPDASPSPDRSPADADAPIPPSAMPDSSAGPIPPSSAVDASPAPAQAMPDPSQNMAPLPPPATAPDASQDQAPQAPALPPGAIPASNGTYGRLEQGIKNEANAIQQQGAQEAKSLATNIAAQQQLQSDYKTKNDALEQERQHFQHDYENGHIDPARLWNNKSTGAKIGTAIGLILGGLGGGMTGTGNQALEFLNKSIDRDIEAQKADLDKGNNLLSANVRQFGNLRDATEMTRLQQMDLVSMQLKQAAAKAQGPMAQANAQKALGQLDEQRKAVQGQLALRQMISGNTPNSQIFKQDPATLVTALVPPAAQKDVFNQIEAAQDTKRMSQSILQSFEDAAKENTVAKTGFGLLRTPASVYGLHQALQPTFKDLEGTVRQAAMDNTFKNITPAPGDSDHTISQKRQSLIQYLQSKASAPTAKGYGIDLNKFESTVPTTVSPQTKNIGGREYQKVEGGWKLIN